MEKIELAIKKTIQQAGISSYSLLRGADLATIQYTQTKVVPLDFERLERNRIVAYAKDSPASLSFDQLRTQVLQKMQAKGWRTLAVVSPTPKCGKTTLAINLAMSISHHTTKTAMLVDFSLRDPKVAEYLGIQPEVSLNEVLDGQVDVSVAMVNPSMPKLVVLPTARPVDKSAEMLASNRVRFLIHELRQKYPERIVIFDLSAISMSDDAIAVLPQMDCALLVVGSGDVSKLELAATMHHLNGCNLLGTVFNKL